MLHICLCAHIIHVWMCAWSNNTCPLRHFYRSPLVQFRVVLLLVVNVDTPNPEEPQNHCKIWIGYSTGEQEGSTCGRKQPRWKDYQSCLGVGDIRLDCRCINLLFIVHRAYTHRKHAVYIFITLHVVNWMGMQSTSNPEINWLRVMAIIQCFF